MPDFYTVRMKRKQIVTRYDEQGRRIATGEILLEEVITDLPYQTAVGYQNKFPDSDVRIERQVSSVGSKTYVNDRTARPRADAVEAEQIRNRSRRTAASSPASPAKSPAGTYGELVNAMVKEGV